MFREFSIRSTILKLIFFFILITYLFWSSLICFGVEGFKYNYQVPSFLTDVTLLGSNFYFMHLRMRVAQLNSCVILLENL